VIGGPLTYVTVTVLSSTLFITNGITYDGDTVMATFGPVLSMRTTRTAWSTLPATVPATWKRYPSLVGKPDTLTKIWYRPPPVESGRVGSTRVPTTVDTPLGSTMENTTG